MNSPTEPLLRSRLNTESRLQLVGKGLQGDRKLVVELGKNGVGAYPSELPADEHGRICEVECPSKDVLQDIVNWLKLKEGQLKYDFRTTIVIILSKRSSI